MVQILMIVPYAQLEPVVYEVIEEYKNQKDVKIVVNTMDVAEVQDASFQCDVIIARGFSANGIRRFHPDIPLVRLQVTGYDIINAAYRCMSELGGKKLGVVGPKALTYEVDNMQGVFGMNIHAYTVEREEETQEILNQVVADGVDCVIGGLSVSREAKKRKLSCVIISSGKSSVRQSIDEGIRLAKMTQTERERSARFKTILDNTQDGMFLVDEAYRIASINEEGKKRLLFQRRQAENLVGRDVEQVVPQFYPFLQQVFRTGDEIKHELQTVEGMIYAVNYTPVKDRKQVMSVLVNMQNINAIQQAEAQIRKKIHYKGMETKYQFEDLVYASGELEETIEKAKKFARVNAPVLIVGESGTGKELFAQSMHGVSGRKKGPFVAVNCAALTETLLESELFGYAEGAFTGANKGGKAGLFEIAHGGTIFLDEISEIPFTFQSKLLRVLQENEVRRVGADKVTAIDIRIIAATNKNLKDMVQKGLFRQDLLFRLDVLRLFIPPLRMRSKDIMKLFHLYVEQSNKTYGTGVNIITNEAKKELERYDWLGNTRELKNIAERLCVLNNTHQISGDDVVEMLYGEDVEAPIGGQCLKEDGTSEREEIIRLLKKHRGSKSAVAEELGIDRTTLWRKIKKLAIKA